MKKLFILSLMAFSALLLRAGEENTITVCADSTITLTADSLGHYYLWSNNATTESVTITPTHTGTQTYSVYVYDYEILSTNNLMANGDFENYNDYHQPPTGFTSDYEYLPFDPYGTNLYDNPQFGGKSGVYLLSNNANHTWRDYANVGPHGGQYFAMFDAAKSGYAWRVTSADNPNMKLQKDGLYLFSYWAADLNKADQRQHPAELQFTIQYRDSLGQMQKDSLGTSMKLGKDNKWHYSETFWIAPCNSDSIIIGVEDLCTHYGVGNDFGLDDIMFQMVTRNITVPIDEQTFTLTVEDCSPCKSFVYSKWDDVLFADNADSIYVSYQWYRDGEPMEGETRQFIYRPGDLDEGVFHCVATRADGTTDHSCERSFADTPRSVNASHTAQHIQGIKYLHEGQLYIRYNGQIYDCRGRGVGRE